MPIKDQYKEMRSSKEVAADYKTDISNQTGIISLVKILQHFGVKNVQKILEKHKDVYDFGLEWKRLRKIAEKYRVKGAMIRPTVDELREVEYPAIAKMNDGAFVTIGSANDEVVLMLDPRQKKPTAISVKQFVESWSNEMMVFSAALSWDFFKKKYNIDWFWMVIKRYKKPLIEVLIANFFLQLMGIGIPLITQVIIDKVIGNNGMSTLMVIGCSMVVFFVMQALIGLMRTYLLNHTTNKLDAILGTRMFRHLMARRRYDSARSGAQRHQKLHDRHGLEHHSECDILVRVCGVHVLVQRASDADCAHNNPALHDPKHLGGADYPQKDFCRLAHVGDE